MAAPHNRPAVVAEIVQRDFLVSQRGANPSITRLDDARLRVAAQRLRHVRVDLGGTEKAGTYSRRNEGMHVDLVLAPVPMSLSASHPTVGRRVRPLRALLITKTFDDYGNFRELLACLGAVAGDLPYELHLDFRQQPRRQGLRRGLTGDVQRLKVLALTEPTKDQESWSADDLRIWVATPTTGEVLDARVLQDPLDAYVLRRSHSSPKPRCATPEGSRPTRRVIRSVTSKPPSPLPGTSHVGPGVVAFGTAGGASSATSLVDAATPFLAVWNDGTVRYLTGARAGERRRITAVATLTGPRSRPRLSRDRRRRVPSTLFSPFRPSSGSEPPTPGAPRTTLVDAEQTPGAGWKGGFVRFLTGLRAPANASRSSASDSTGPC